VIEDPANPEGNDLSDLLSNGLRTSLKSAASRTLEAVDNGSWEKVLGPLKKGEAEKSAAIAAAVAVTSSRTKPWSRS